MRTALLALIPTWLLLTSVYPVGAQPTLAPQQQIQRNVRPQAPQSAPVSVDEAALQVMMLSSQDAQEDLHDMLSAMDAERQRRNAIRQAVTSMRQRQSSPLATATTTTLPSNPCQGSTSTLWLRCLDGVTAKLATVQGAQRDADLDAQLSALRDELDRERELDTDVSTRIQMQQERTSQAYRTLSNMLRRMSETQSAIIQNMK